MPENDASTRIRRRQNNRILSLPRRLAWRIRAMCLECMGWQTTEVPRCTAPKCPLYPWRMGKFDQTAQTKQEEALAGKE